MNFLSPAPPPESAGNRRAARRAGRTYLGRLQYREEELARAAAARAAQEAIVADEAFVADSQPRSTGLTHAVVECRRLSASERSRSPTIDCDEWRRVLSVNLDGAFLTPARSAARDPDERRPSARSSLTASVGRDLLADRRRPPMSLPGGGDPARRSPPRISAPDGIRSTRSRRRFDDDDLARACRFGSTTAGIAAGSRNGSRRCYMDERIDWSPATSPTASPGAPVTIDDQIAVERVRRCGDFIRRHGV